MWPNFVQGPYGLTSIENINITYKDNNSYKTKIYIFGEFHATTQCNDNVMDVVRNENGEYVFIQGSDTKKWSIGRLLYVLAKSTHIEIDYFFELAFKDTPNKSGDNTNILSLISLFYECLTESKEACQFLPKVFMHAIDYRTGHYSYAYQDNDTNRLRSFAEAFFLKRYDMIEGWFSRELWDVFQKYYYISDKDMFNTFTPMFVWESISTLCTRKIHKLYKIDEAIVNLLIRTLEIIYGAEFDIVDILFIYYAENPRYINYIREKVKVVKPLLKQWEIILSENVLSTPTAFNFALNVTFILKQYVVICERILQNNHHSIKKSLNGVIISRAAHQLLKLSQTKIGEHPVSQKLEDWAESLKGNLLTGFAWKHQFNDMFYTAKSSEPRLRFLDRMLSDAGYFMDIAFIARMFLRNSSLKVCFVGNAHAERVRAFFEFCRFNTNTVIAKENACIELPPEVKETFTQAVMTGQGIHCEYCPSLAELKCNVCEQGHTCKADAKKWEKHHMCKKY